MRFGSKRGKVVYLSQGMREGKHVWHYILVDKLKLPILKREIQQGQIDLMEYGRILFSGFGRQPPAEISLHVRQYYG